MLKKFVLLVAAASLIATITPSAAHAGDWRWHFCRFQTMDGHHGFATVEVRRTIRCATRKFDVSFPTALCIAHRESGAGLYPYARNPYSSATGIFQVVSGTWASWQSAFTRKWHHWRVWRDSSVTNARTNVMRSVYVMHRYGLSAWGGGCS
jgi:hypothetical protein